MESSPGRWWRSGLPSGGSCVGRGCPEFGERSLMSALSTAKPSSSLCCLLDRAARWPKSCLEINNGKQAMQSPQLKKPRAWIGLFLLWRMVSAEQGWGQHKEISKPVSPGTALPSLPSSSLAWSRAIAQACAASGCVFFKPICREKQLFSLG